MFLFKKVFKLLLWAWILLACQKLPVMELTGHTMGTTYHIKLADPVASHLNKSQLQQAIDSVLERVNQQMSTYRPQSEISRFNRWHSTKPFKVSAEFAQVVRKALEMYRLTSGAFDITVGPLVDLWGFGKNGARFELPEETLIQQTLKRIGSHQLKIYGDTALCKLNPVVEIDLSAIAKGYGVDAVAQLLKHRGIRNFMVEIGGEVVVSGKKYGRLWHIGVEQPQYKALPGQNIEALLNLTDCAVATSGDYRNFFQYQGQIFSHEIDPRTGWPVSNGLASVTVIASDCMTADALATAIMIMGAEQGLALVHRLKDTEALILKRISQNEFKIFTSKGFQKYLTQTTQLTSKLKNVK